MATEEFCEYTGADKNHAHTLLQLADGEIGVAMQLWATAQGYPCTFSVDEEDTVQTEWTDVVGAMRSSSYGKIMKIMQRIDTLSTATELELPRIVVIGSESSGKSSTLERIAGLALFPRDSNICTRMPTVLRLINIEEESAEVKDAGLVTLKHPSREDVKVKEDEAAHAISKLMQELVPSGMGVDEEPLTIEIRKRSLPTLEMIDLPGIVAASVSGEPSDMMQRTRNITDKYLRCEDTIVIAVVPANTTRVRDSQAMQMVQANKKEGVTLGVLAKCDLAYDPRFKQHQQSTPYWQLEKRLAGEADDMITLCNAWLAVKNRDTQIAEEESSDFAQSLEAERDWFANDANISREIRETQCGVEALLKSINGLFTKHFRSMWVPKAISHVRSKMTDVKTKLMLLGPLPQLLSLGEVLDAFMETFRSDLVSLKTLLFQDMFHEDNPSIYTWTEPWQSPTNEFDSVKKWGVQYMDVYVRSIENAVRTSFLTYTSGMCLSRFEVLREKVVEVVGCLVASKAHALERRLQNLIWQITYMAPICSCSMDNAGLRLSMHAIVVHVLVTEAVVNNMDELKRQVMHHFGADNTGGSCQATGSSQTEVNADNACSMLDTSMNPGLLECCAVERANLARDTFNLFIALRQLKRLEEAVEESTERSCEKSTGIGVDVCLKQKKTKTKNAADKNNCRAVKKEKNRKTSRAM